MDLSLTADQEALREAFGDLLAKESTPARVRAAEPSGYDEELWRTLVAADVPLMGVPSGGGASLAELVVVAREAGRRLAPVPLVEAWVAARLLARFPAGVALLRGVGTGEILPTLAVRPVAGPAAAPVARLVPGGAVADAVVVLAGDELLLVRRDGPRPYAPVPPNLGCQPLADVPLAGGVPLAQGPEAREAFAAAVTEWTLLTAATLDGLRAEALRIGVEYVTERHAFGVPIGWFQTVAHRLADAVTAGEGAELLVHEAAWALDGDRPRGAALASMAFLHAAEVAFVTTRACLQFHGGYGYTLEYDIQLYLRRAKAWPLALGAPRDLYRALAREVF
ncbi:acyl-CoA dehydrogenase family protein [Cryptosporangium aurantiacum]|uniref:Acyl-CoA dehydrogenase n=1 Tax=Cryptosporangium aurantiacum TaxID=134849 RepID=A0A1M7RK79_9ACTN|nr:acyl-CoA dehydrogenase family protein [Cryptosporangium aurantiacum]SHN46569.1 Acyl-CoA dehydrogenase [Cryptosporangium aurantiacum]